MKKNISIRDSDFVFSDSYFLLFELNDGFYNYAIIDSVDNSLKEIGSSDILLSDRENILFKHNFSKIKASIVTKSFSFIPESLFKGDKDFLPFAGIDDNETSFSGYIEKGIRNVFGLNKGVVSFFGEHFDSCSLYPQMLSFYNGCKYSDGFFANIKGEIVEILIVKNGQLFFYNIFEFKNDDELLYFLLLVARQKNIDANSAVLKISGEISDDSLIFQRVKTLFPYAELNIPNIGINISGDFEKVHLHRYFSLLNILSCE